MPQTSPLGRDLTVLMKASTLSSGVRVVARFVAS